MQIGLKRWSPLFVLPTLAAFTVAFIAPFLMGLYLSFCDFRTVTDATFVGLKNYMNIFSPQDTFFKSLLLTTLFAAISVITINVFAFLLAIMLTKGIRGTNFFRTVFFMPNLIGGIVLGYIWQVIINGALYNYGYAITSKAEFGIAGLIVMMNWQMIGYMMVIYIAAIQNVPDDILEAARVDGAGKFRTLFSIIIPSVMPSITICLFLTITNSFKLFDQNLALTAGAPAKQTQLAALDIYNTFYGRTGFEGTGQAKAVIFFIIVAIIALLQLKLTGSKEVES